MTLALHLTKPPTRSVVSHRVLTLDDVHGVIRGYIFIWGDPDHRDSYGTWFDKARPPKLDIENGMHRRPFMYEHAADPAVGMETLGTITEVGFDDIGAWFIAELDKSSPFFPRVWEEVEAGILFTSSATGEHTADWREDGSFEKWTLLEVTATQNPSESRIPKLVTVRSGSPVDDTEGERDAARVESYSADDLARHGAASPTLSPVSVPQEERSMTLAEQIAAILADTSLDDAAKAQAITALLAQSTEPEAVPTAMAEDAMPEEEEEQPVAMSGQRSNGTDTNAILLTTLVDQLTNMNRRVASMEAAQRRTENAPPEKPKTRVGGNNGVGANVNLIEARKYAQLSTDAMMVASEVMRSAGVRPSDSFTRALAHRGLELVKRDSASPVMQAYRSAFTRADDFMASNITGQGAEWVGVFYSEQIWEKARTQPILQALLSKGLMDIDVPDGRDRAVVPLESSDPVFYTTAQANDKDASGLPETVVNVGFAGTGSATITPGQLTAAVAYTDILSEDAVLAGGLVAQLNRQMNEAAIRMPEYVLLNGDTTTTASTNINLIDGTPGSGLNAPAYLVSDGALKLALVTNTAQARDGGTLADDDFRLTKGLLNSDARSNPEGIVFILDPDTYDAALGMLATKTRDVAGVDATLFTGKLPPLYGVDILRSGQMALANSSGKIPAAGGTLGRILAMYAPFWAMVWKRRITFETARLPFSQTNAVICSMRIAVRARDATLSTSKAAAVSYNLTVTS